MTSNNHLQNREIQQGARAWAEFTGTKYTAALRQMNSPLAQGLLGERVDARQLIAVLHDHELVGARVGDPVLSENGFLSEAPWSFNGETDFIELALITDVLRIFTPISKTATPEVSSYSLKHTVEQFLSPHCPYVSNGRLIWAAAALGLPIAEPEVTGPNLLIGITEREHDYVRRAVGGAQPGGHHHRPAGYEYLRHALVRAAAGELITDRWVRPSLLAEVAPFHDWLRLQAGRSDSVGDLASDYCASARDGDHRIARTADELLTILHEVRPSPEAYEAAVRAIAEWMTTEPSPAPIRTKPISRDGYDHGGWGAGAGTVERYEYRCPCGDGKIIEEHENVPGFREHDVRIDCDRCRTEWRFVDGRSVSQWGIEPASEGTGVAI